MGEYLGATKKRKEKSAIVREMLIQHGVAFMRNRTKSIFTSWDLRIKGKRGLTRLDRALTDNQAFALDRAYTAWLVLEGKANCAASGVHTISGSMDGGKIPLNQHEFELVGRYRAGIAKWSKQEKGMLEGLFRIIAPWSENQNIRPDTASIAQIVELAKKLEEIY